MSTDTDTDTAVGREQHLVQVCTSCSIPAAIDLLSQNRELCTKQITWTDPNGDEHTTPPIFIAIDYEHVTLVEQLIPLHTSNMLNTITGGDGEYSVLQWACFTGNLQIIKLLIENGKAIADEESLSLAREEDHTDVMEYLVKRINFYADFEHLYGSEEEDDADSLYMERMSGNVVDESTDDTIKNAVIEENQREGIASPAIRKSTNTCNHLIFSIPSQSDNDDLEIKLHQAITTDENQGDNETNTGFVMWPAAVMLSHHLTQNPEIVLGLNDNGDDLDGNIMELGSGCGLAGLTAATLLENDGSSDKVIFTDYNPSVLDNLRRNVSLNDFEVDHKVLGLDWFDQQQQTQQQSNESEREGDIATTEQHHHAKKKRSDSDTWVDMDGIEHSQARLIIGSDLIVCSNDADLVASTINIALMEGGQAIILGADSNTRFGVRDFPDACRTLGLDVVVNENIWESTEVAGERQQLKDELELGGYNQRAACIGHDFTMFTIDKPIKTSV